MADKLKTHPTTLHTEPSREQPLARVQGVPWLIVIVLLAAVAWLGWRAFFYEEEGDPVGSAMLAFEKQNSLVVFNSRFQVVAQSTNTSRVMGVPIMESAQAMIVPATVDYRLDLSQMDRDRMSWDGEAKTLEVRLPPLRTSEPNIDEAEALFFEEGLFVTGTTSRSLSTNNSEQAGRKATAFAKNPQVMALARSAAKAAIRQNLTIPLQVAGYGDVTVNVRFDGEKAPQ
ncbi:DUF4230 domain-containing protein [Qipengyuania marisflavi]|uniref:DUF4230 domain-containing protein n=1 Tax=Qipengyuania marisflavi TaxID=2486356 RepID=A0A5S3P301_9SPHN|nr:DUF4230 domain-containing protein [Qipengyuania marisflavi]TMM47362.1 DUF4230 domain-containing protein [Qipengyuania marisflavi]